MKTRLVNTLKPVVVILLIGIIYTIIVKTFDVGIPCLFYTVTGLYCPGCGVSRVILNILSLDFVSAFNANPVIFVLLPILGVGYVIHQYRYIVKNDKSYRTYENVFLWIAISALILFAVYRNLVEFNIL